MAKKKSAKSKQVANETEEQESDSAPESFEQALDDAQQIVRDLESGELSLEDSLKSYELGVRRIRQCETFLNNFERRVELLVGFDSEGNPVTKPFDEEEMTLEEKQQARGRRRGAGAAKRKTDLGDGTPELF